MATNFDYNAYTRRYRATHPQKRDKWRYRSSLKYCLQYESANPDTAAEIRAKVEKEVTNA